MSEAGVSNALVVAAQPLACAGYEALIKQCTENYHVEVATDAGSALALCRIRPPRLLICEYDLPGISGGELARKLLSGFPELAALMVIDPRLAYMMRQLICNGIRGFITRQSNSHEFGDALNSVKRGERFMAPSLATAMAFGNDTASPSPFQSLSGREMEIVRLILSGRKNQEIADALFISDKTVSTYRARALAKLGVRSTAELTMAAMRDGVITTS